MKEPDKAFKKFRAEFSTLCQRFGGVEKPEDAIGYGACFHIPTGLGTLRASIHFDGWKNRRGNSHIDSIFLQWIDYTWHGEFPIYGDFNPFSHKWNILISGEVLAQVRQSAMVELENRLEQLKEKFPVKSL